MGQACWWRLIAEEIRAEADHFTFEPRSRPRLARPYSGAPLGRKGVLTQPSAFSGHGCCPRLLSAIGSTSLGSLFLTLPTRALTGQHVISSEVGSQKGLELVQVRGLLPELSGPRRG